ncbi:MAG: CBS domain-containing protein [Chitinophagia bacterium]|jgi:CBS domain-containing protein|nr:CBS domain-containing protein [Chitinophagia bacterium]
MKVAEILKAKGNNIFSITSDYTVYDALKVMGEKNIGALLVIENQLLVGIISERDYARKIILKGKSSQDTLVKEIMTKDVISVSPGDKIDKCMELMSEKHIRHLPVMQDGIVTGIISITDVVTAIIESQKETISLLHNYISQ